MSSSSHPRLLQVSELVDLAADLVTLRADTPLPPGTRVRFELELPHGGTPLGLVGKIVGLEREGPTTFAVRVRLHSLPREARAVLADLVASREE